MPNHHRCCWVLRPASKGQAAEYCGKPVRYKMIKDDDGATIRQYNPFCEEHQRQADEMGDQDD